MIIVVTRPSPYGEELVQLCQQAKLAVKHLPFFNIVKGQDLDHLQYHLDYLRKDDIVIVVSPQVNLMLKVLQKKIQFPDFVRYFAVGEQTAKQFHAITDQTTLYPPENENSEGLIQYFKSINLSVTQHNVLILCGDIGRTVIKDSLSGQGALVKDIECYQRRPICYPETIFNPQQDYCFVITSIEHLLQLEHYCSEQQKYQSRLIVSSERIKAEAELHCWRNITSAESANNQNLFKTITTLCHNVASI